VKNRSKTKI
jgi:hypothetical protein